MCAADQGSELGWHGWGKGVWSNWNHWVNQSLLEWLVMKTFLSSRQMEHPLSPSFLPLLQQLEHLRFPPFSLLFHSTIAIYFHISKADEPKPRPHHSLKCRAQQCRQNWKTLRYLKISPPQIIVTPTLCWHWSTLKFKKVGIQAYQWSQIFESTSASWRARAVST